MLGKFVSPAKSTISNACVEDFNKMLKIDSMQHMKCVTIVNVFRHLKLINNYLARCKQSWD